MLEADARRRGADYVLKPCRRAAADSLRRSSRLPARIRHPTADGNGKPVIGGLPISVDDAPARIIDVSYGGLRFEMQRER